VQALAIVHGLDEVAMAALARDLTLITHNVRAFERIAGLRIEDWE
jgi:tRNA(fMet)-specific endonuclease VapC